MPLFTTIEENTCRTFLLLLLFQLSVTIFMFHRLTCGSSCRSPPGDGGSLRHIRSTEHQRSCRWRFSEAAWAETPTPPHLQLTTGTSLQLVLKTGQSFIGLKCANAWWWGGPISPFTATRGFTHNVRSEKKLFAAIKMKKQTTVQEITKSSIICSNL